MALINIPDSGLWASIASSLNLNFGVIEANTGWGSYADTQYTTAARFSIPANTNTLLPNNKVNIIESQLPSDVATFYDGTVIPGRNGDGIIISIDFSIVPTAVGTTLAEVWIDITGGTGTPVNLANLYRRAFNFPKGTGVERKISFSHSGYTLGTWQANGGVVKIRTDGTADIFDVSYIITRSHKAR
tara:strand:- start:198 stop:758 length:561 start_codon:yes stop_codon:yes gene_type:complete